MAQADVDAFLEGLEHPQKPELQALRQILLAVDPAVEEGIKWNAPSFRAGEDFATFHLRGKDGLQLILHRGAKKRAQPLDPQEVPDPAGLLRWLGPDRAVLRVKDPADLERQRPALEALFRAWIARL